MKIFLNNIGKRFNNDWIFRNLNCEFYSGKKYAILGENGSGKSTLIQVIAGYLTQSEGKITYELNGTVTSSDNIFRFVSMAAPYIDLPEEFTLIESVKFHFNFKTMQNIEDPEKLIDKAELNKEKNKQLKYFSSGMKQRLRLALTIFSCTPVLLLDEPTTNLDDAAKEWYKKNIHEFTKEKLVIICSNQIHEHDFCDEQILLHRLKK